MSEKKEEIIIADKFRVSHDNYSYTVSEIKIKGKESKEAGSVYYDNTTFHLNLKAVIQNLTERGIHDNFGDLTGFLEFSTMLEEKFDEFLELQND